MERTQKLLFLVALWLSAIASTNAQNICKIPVSGLMACRPAVTSPNPTPPTTTCCSALSHADIPCLCSYKNSNLLPSLG
ncbi:hypothetical protein J0J24_24745, partial [Vibrio vulnificus]|nr:hypothetical protein [Vibrio vulnificus]